MQLLISTQVWVPARNTSVELIPALKFSPQQGHQGGIGSKPFHKPNHDQVWHTLLPLSETTIEGFKKAHNL